MRAYDYRGQRSLHLATALLNIASMCLLLSAQSAKAPDAKCKPGSKAAACTSKSEAGAPAEQGSSDAKPPASAADFAFPVEDSKHGSDAEGTLPPLQQPTNRNGLPEMPTSAVPDPPASSQQPVHLPPGGYGSSSSSGDDLPPGTSSSRSPDDDDVAPTAPSPNAPVKASALKDLGSRGDTTTARAKLEVTRVEDDLKVGRFYMKDGNAQGAYLRFRDALSRAPDDPDIRFNVAESAMALQKRDEAVQNYREVLRLDPGGDHDKASRKALSKLGASVQ